MIETILEILKNNTKDVTIGVLSSISASYMFLYYTDKFRVSKVKVSEFIAQKKRKRYENDFIIFKMVNLSKRPIYDVEFSWKISENRIYQNGHMTTHEEHIMNGLPPIPDIINGYNKSDKYAGYAYQFGIPLDRKLDKNETIIFRLSFNDSYSGTKRHISKSYSNEKIKIGEFAFGKSMKIL